VTHPSTLHIDLDAIAHNHGVITSVAERAARDGAGSRTPAGLCAVLKADGYGLGATRLGKRLASLGLDMIAVYHPDEARELLSVHLGVPVLIFMPVRGIAREDRLFHALSRGLIHLSIHDRGCLEAASAIADSLGLSLPVHVAVDTGMGRAGSPPDEAHTLMDAVLDHRRLTLAGIATHFASADASHEITADQLAAFDEFLSRYALPGEPAADGARPLPRNVRVHAANSFALFRTGAAHRTMVRAGIALLGYAGEEFADAESFEHADLASELKPALRWTSSIVQVKRIEPGGPVGYGSTWIAPKPNGAWLGTVPVGYADGYPLALSSRPGTGEPTASVRVRRADGSFVPAPIVGRVSMDQITLDLSAFDDPGALAGVEVELVTPDATAPTHLPALAKQAGTITHELLCRLSARVDRSYVTRPEVTVGDTRPLTPSVVAGQR
jgi:alanine racemase